jgi:hypothetical protein
MLTKNFNKLIFTLVTSYSGTTTLVDRDGQNVTNNTSAYYLLGYIFSSKFGLSNNLNDLEAGTNKEYTVFGFGDGTADTEYSLANMLDNSQFVNRGHSATIATNRENDILTMSFEYTGTSEITIKEIGLFMKVNSTANSKSAMLAREVLDSPITVKSGDTFTVSMVIG